VLTEYLKNRFNQNSTKKAAFDGLAIRFRHLFKQKDTPMQTILSIKLGEEKNRQGDYSARHTNAKQTQPAVTLIPWTKCRTLLQTKCL